MILSRDFFNRNSALVARELVGKELCRNSDGVILSGIITQVEAYFDHTDSASHAFKGQTDRNSVMFGPPGFSYVYFIYGMYYMLNIVTEQKGHAGAVLIRALRPVRGVEQMIRLRNGREQSIADGPGKLCQAMRIDKTLNNIDVTTGYVLWMQDGRELPDKLIKTGPRIGIDYAKKHDREAPLRFWTDFDF